MVKYLGSFGNLALFSSGSFATVVNTEVNLVTEFGELSSFETYPWNPATPVSEDVVAVAEGSFEVIKNPLIASGNRMYTIPGTVQAEAKKALAWHKEHGRGGTPVGLNTARILAAGGQIGINKIRHIAKYFPRHEVDKKGKGWTPGEDNFPSNGRVAWALWGGDAGWRWAKTIVERENKKAIAAGGFYTPENESNIQNNDYQSNYSSDINAFIDAHEMDEAYGPEFMARVCADGSGIDRLYKIDIDGRVYIWDDCSWDDLGDVYADVYSYDYTLDDEYDTDNKTHVVIDPGTAVIISAMLQERPYSKVSIEDINEPEARMVANAMADMDFNLIDTVITAAGEAADGYTPQERSQNVQRQARNSKGWWIKSNDRVTLAGDQARGGGTVSGVNADGTVKVKLDSGTEVNVEGKYLHPESDSSSQTPAAPAAPASSLDTSGILGDQKDNAGNTEVRLPDDVTPMDSKDLKQLMDGYGKYVSDYRSNAKTTAVPAATVAPVTAAAPVPAAADKNKALTPETTDVPAKYLAIVSPDDPQAVMDFVAIVPASATSVEPMVYKRKDKQWVQDDQILRDLKSATPPPVVEIKDPDLINNVLQQVDKLVNTGTGVQASALYNHLLYFWSDVAKSVTAAGGLDRNRGNAEKLRRYWVHGEGAAKIRWGQKGDWSRCVRHLAKYLGVRAKGYCQLRHKEATGIYTATHAKLDRQHNHFATNEFIMEQVWAKNTGTPTYIEDSDLLLPVDQIQNQHDNLYDGDWEPNSDIVEALKDLSKCGEEEFLSLVAAGGLDRNRGNAEELRHYWTRGEGSLKVRWGTPGDWTRCVRHLAKYMGPRAKGYCQLRHKEVTGVYTGSRLNPGRHNNKAYFSMFSSEDSMVDAVIAQSQLIAKANSARERVSGALVASAGDSGAKFTIPLLIPETMESGDGRKFKKDAIEIRELPLPLLWQIKTGEGHMGSVVVGRIDHMERTDNGIGNAYGVFDTGAYGKEAERLVRNGFIRGISADLDQFEAKEYTPENSEKDDELAKQKIIINHARVMAATIVAKPAFQECVIFINGEPENQEEEVIPQDGVYEESVDSFVVADALIASGFLESEIPVTPPNEWFQNPGFTKATPLTVDANGKIYGHIAAWHVNHIGMPRATRPPRSKSGYAYFHTGVVRCDNGKDIPVGQLTLAGGHASLNASATEAAKHYDDTASAIADVHAGEDDYGIWVSGSLRPGATEAQIRQLRASAPSGDWRPIGGTLELVAVCQVNVPGFPIARAMVAGGAVMALVAAGAYEMAVLKSQAVMSLSYKAQAMSELGAATDAVLERAEAAFGYIPRAKREEYAKKGWAMPDGAFPIKTKDDVKAAIHAYGRAKDKEAARKHIIKRARQLKVSDLIPDEWKNPKTTAVSAQVMDMRHRAIVASAVAELASIPEEERKRLAKSGEALPDGSYPIRNEKDLKNAIKAYGRSNPSDRAKVRAHIKKRARALGAPNLVPEDWKTAASADAQALVASMRSKISEFADAAPAPVDPNVPQATDEQIAQLQKAQAEADKQTKDEIARANDLEQGKPIADKQDLYNQQTGRTKYTPSTQPRDARGKYREVLARLKQDLGVSGLQNALQKAQKAEDMDFAGNYTESAKAGQELIGMLDRLDTKALNPKDLENVKGTAKELGKVISNLPLPFGQEAEKMKFSDLPSNLKELMGTMIDKVEKKIGKKDADVATAKLKSFISGADLFSQSEVQSEMSTLLRLLT